MYDVNNGRSPSRFHLIQRSANSPGVNLLRPPISRQISRLIHWQVYLHATNEKPRPATGIRQDAGQERSARGERLSFHCSFFCSLHDLDGAKQLNILNGIRNSAGPRPKKNLFSIASSSSMSKELDRTRTG